VARTRVGYSGGEKPHPSYDDIGDHTETVEVDFDPKEISFAKIMEIYAQAPNVDSPSSRRQYRNVVFYHDSTQQQTAQQVLDRLGKSKVALEPFRDFTRAEDYHQKYHLQLSTPLMKDCYKLFPDSRSFVDSTATARINGFLMGHGDAEQVKKDLPQLGLSPESQETLLKAHHSPGFDCR
jgi:hypothetical protein